MGTPGKPIDESTRREILRRKANGQSVYRIAREVIVSEPTVRKILRQNLLTSFGKPPQQ